MPIFCWMGLSSVELECIEGKIEALFILTFKIYYTALLASTCAAGAARRGNLHFPVACRRLLPPRQLQLRRRRRRPRCQRRCKVHGIPPLLQQAAPPVRQEARLLPHQRPAPLRTRPRAGLSRVVRRLAIAGREAATAPSGPLHRNHHLRRNVYMTSQSCVHLRTLTYKLQGMQTLH